MWGGTLEAGSASIVHLVAKVPEMQDIGDSLTGGSSLSMLREGETSSCEAISGKLRPLGHGLIMLEASKPSLGSREEVPGAATNSTVGTGLNVSLECAELASSWS